MNRRKTIVTNPGLGLILDRPAYSIPEQGLRDCLNVRIRDQSVVRDNMGYGTFPNGAPPINLDGRPVTLVDNFLPRGGGQLFILGNTTDIFRYDEASEGVVYLTPTYTTGTVSVTNASATVTGTGTSWDGTVAPGDFLYVGNNSMREQSSDWYRVDSVQSDTELTLETPYAGSTASGEDYTVRLAFGGALSDYFDTEVFYGGEALTEGDDGDRWYATNGIDPVVAWDGVTDEVYFPDLGDLETARFLNVQDNIMIFGNIRTAGQVKPFSVRTSAIGRPEDTVTLEASEFIVHSSSDALLQSYTIGESSAIYGERSVTLMQFVGPPTVFVFRIVLEGIGPRSSRAVADFGDHHKFMGPDAQYTFDGVGLQRTNSHVWREIIRRLSPQRQEMILSHFDEENGEVLWVVPTNSDTDSQEGGPERAWVEHYLERPDGMEDPMFNPYTLRGVPATAMGYYERVSTLTFNQISASWADQNFRWNDQFYQAAFPFTVFGDINGNLFILNTSDSVAGTALLSFARFGRRMIGTSRHKSIVRRVYPMVNTLPTADHDMTVILRTYDQAGGEARSATSYEYSMQQATPQHFVVPRQTGRWIDVEFRTQGIGQIWTLIGYDIDTVPGGGR